MDTLKHRLRGYELLAGNGLEIGALHQPAPVPAGCTLDYCDAISREDAIKLFPELNSSDLVEVKYICDLDKEQLLPFDRNSFDFVIFNHVIEHIANPIKSIEEIFRITRPEGFVVISAPDKRYIFDKNRCVTSFDHLFEEYKQAVKEVTEGHYVDFLRGVCPEVFDQNDGELRRILGNVRQRREHAHVWTSEMFKEFLDLSFEILDIRGRCLYESTGDDNKFEYFAVFKKL